MTTKRHKAIEIFLSGRKLADGDLIIENSSAPAMYTLALYNARYWLSKAEDIQWSRPRSRSVACEIRLVLETLRLVYPLLSTNPRDLSDIGMRNWIRGVYHAMLAYGTALKP